MKTKKSLVNKIVEHGKYGKGKIVKFKEDYIYVQFEGMDREVSFLYPDAFEKFLTFKEKEQEERVEQDLQDKKDQAQAEEDERFEKYKQMYDVALEQHKQDTKGKKRKPAAKKK